MSTSAPPVQPRAVSGTIRVRNLRLCTALVPDAWGRVGKPQPTLVSVTLERADRLEAAAAADDCSLTASYSEVAKVARQVHEHRDQFLATAQVLVCERAARYWGAAVAEVETVFPKGLLRGAGGWGLRTRGDGRVNECTYLVRDLTLACVIGVNAHERERKQDVVVNAEVTRRRDFAVTVTQEDWTDMVELMVKRIEESTFLTVEALALDVSKLLGHTRAWRQTLVRVEKPVAISYADGCGVEMVMDWNEEGDTE